MKGAAVLVIGGSSGIGLATARLAMDQGAQVTIASRSLERLADAASKLGAVRTAVLDVCDAGAVERFFAAHAPWQTVIVAGSSTRVGPVRGLSLDDARAAMDNKFWGAYHVGRHARFADGASLTFVSGVYGIRPSADAVLQGVINSALESLARGLALELAPVRVNAVSQSTTATPLWDRLGPQGRQAKFDEMAARLPVGRIASADDIAAAILFVATNRFATGSTVLVDGGDALV
ncbi:SDR family oxidoreductase [soil metagenome]